MSSTPEEDRIAELSKHAAASRERKTTARNEADGEAFAAYLDLTDGMSTKDLGELNQFLEFLANRPAGTSPLQALTTGTTPDSSEPASTPTPPPPTTPPTTTTPTPDPAKDKYVGDLEDWITGLANDHGVAIVRADGRLNLGPGRKSLDDAIQRETEKKVNEAKTSVLPTDTILKSDSEKAVADAEKAAMDKIADSVLKPIYMGLQPKEFKEKKSRNPLVPTTVTTSPKNLEALRKAYNELADLVGFKSKTPTDS